MPNRFRDPTMRREYDATVAMFRQEHRNLFIDGKPHRGSTLAGQFWHGFNGTHLGAGFTDRASKEMLAYAYWCAGRDMRAELEKKTMGGLSPVQQALLTAVAVGKLTKELSLPAMAALEGATAPILHQVNDDLFHADDGRRMEREYGETPNGNPLGGRWVLRSGDAEFLDFDKYRHDLAERHGLRFNY